MTGYAMTASSRSRCHEKMDAIKGLRSYRLDEIAGFFVDYNKLHGRKFKPLGNHGPGKALDHIKHGCRVFDAKHRKRKK